MAFPSWIVPSDKGITSSAALILLSEDLESATVLGSIPVQNQQFRINSIIVKNDDSCQRKHNHRKQKPKKRKREKNEFCLLIKIIRKSKSHKFLLKEQEKRHLI